ncbi:MAG: phosphoribosyltransferase family protein [Promethearchaeota archaeon]
MNWEEEKIRFNNFIIENNVIGLFKSPILLKSGRESYWYVNWRNVAADVYLLDKLTDYLLSYIEYLDLKPTCFFGVPEGASKLGIIIQFKWAKKQKNYNAGVYTLSMGRGLKKEHGDPKDRVFLGIPNGKVIILEDAVTTGDALVSTINELKKIGINIIATIVLTDRNELRDDGKTVEEIILEQGIKYYAMSNAIELLPNLKLDKEVAKKIEEYYKKYGSKEITLTN